MNELQHTRQAQACHIRFKQLQSEGVLDAGLTVYAYAQQVLGVQVESLKALKDCELNALRDTLEGKPPKVLEKLYAAAERAGIKNLAAWMVAARGRYGRNAWMRGHTPETLPYTKKWHLIKMLERRSQ